MIIHVITAVLWIIMAVVIIVQQRSPSWWITSLMAALLAGHATAEAMEGWA